MGIVEDALLRPIGFVDRYLAHIGGRCFCPAYTCTDLLRLEDLMEEVLLKTLHCGSWLAVRSDLPYEFFPLDSRKFTL